MPDQQATSSNKLVRQAPGVGRQAVRSVRSAQRRDAPMEFRFNCKKACSRWELLKPLWDRMGWNGLWCALS